MRKNIPTLLTLGLGTLVFVSVGCGKEAAADLTAIPFSLPLPEPPTPIVDMQVSENYSLEIEDRFFVIADELEQGDTSGLEAFLSPQFQGHSLAGLPNHAETDLGFGGLETEMDVTQPAVVSGTEFLKSWGDLFQGWQDLEFVRFDLALAEFQPGRPTWGKATVDMHVVGHDQEGRIRSHAMRFGGLFYLDRAKWYMQGFELVSWKSQHRDSTLFTDVSAEAGISYAGMPEDQSPFPFRHLRLPYNGAAAGDINGDGFYDLFASGKERNFLYINQQDGTYKEVAQAWGVLTPADGTGAVFFDYDMDGDQDLAVAGEGQFLPDGREQGNHFRLYRNEGDHFADVSEETGLKKRMFSYSLSILDYDNDGFLDIFVCNYGLFGVHPNNSWDNANNGDADALFRNIDGKRFEEVTEEAGLAGTGWSFASAVADYDRDGDQDIYIAHDYAPNSFWQNQGDGTFRDIAMDFDAEDLGFGMSASFADLNNDSLLDIYVANMDAPTGGRITARLSPAASGVMGMMKLARGNTMLFQGENGQFHSSPDDIGGIAGRWAWGCAPNDFDLDGRIDVFCTNGYTTRPGVGDMNSSFWRHVVAATADVTMEPSVFVAEEPNNKRYSKEKSSQIRAGRSWSGWERDKLWLNRGKEGFLDISDISGADSLGDGRAAIAFDHDNDGDLDLFLNEWSFEKKNVQLLLRNDIQPEPTGWLKIRLVGTECNYQAVGAEVTVTTDAFGPCSQVLALGSGFLSCFPDELLFGLGEDENVEVSVLWPGGERESFGNIAANSRVVLKQGAGKAVPFSSQ